MRFVELYEEFHDHLSNCPATTLRSVVREMRWHLDRLRYLELQEARHEEAAVVDHEKILAAIRANDADRTSNFLRTHLKTLEQFRGEIFERHRAMFV